LHPQLGAATSHPQLGAGSQQLFLANLLLSLPIMSLRQFLRAGLQHVGAASHPQLGAASQPQLGAGAAQHVGAGAGAAQHVGAGAAQQVGAGASQQTGAGSQQLFLLPSLLIMPLILLPSWHLGLQTGAASQHVGAGASQQTGAGSQQDDFLLNRPADALDDEIAAETTTAKVMINRRMELTPKIHKSFVNRAVILHWLQSLSGTSPVATIP
jgi:hypothetical protein